MHIVREWKATQVLRILLLCVCILYTLCKLCTLCLIFNPHGWAAGPLDGVCIWVNKYEYNANDLVSMVPIFHAASHHHLTFKVHPLNEASSVKRQKISYLWVRWQCWLFRHLTWVIIYILLFSKCWSSLFTKCLYTANASLDVKLCIVVSCTNRLMGP